MRLHPVLYLITPTLVFDRCPLYSDLNTLHMQAVLEGAKKAKEQVDANNLKIDPTADLHNHYKAPEQAVSTQPPPPPNPLFPQIRQDLEALRRYLGIVIHGNRRRLVLMPRQ